MDDVSSEVESFNEDDMYALDDAMMVVSESSDESDSEPVLPQPPRNVGNILIYIYVLLKYIDRMKYSWRCL